MEKKDKEVLLFWPSGKLKRKCHFHEGMRHGSDQMWDEAGHLVDEGSYDKGRPIGFHRRWKGAKLIEEIEYLPDGRLNVREWDEEGSIRVEALWQNDQYKERVWDRFQNVWVEKQGFWNGKKLIYV